MYGRLHGAVPAARSDRQRSVTRVHGAGVGVVPVPAQFTLNLLSPNKTSALAWVSYLEHQYKHGPFSNKLLISSRPRGGHARLQHVV